MAITPNKIQVVSEYIDLSSAKIKQSFQQNEQAVDRYAKEVEKMRNSIKRSMLASRKEMTEALNGITAALQKQKKPTEEVIGGAVRMAKVYEALRIGFARMRNTILLVNFAVRPLVNIFKDVVESAATAEDAVNRLNASLQIQGTYSKMTSDRLIELSSAFQQTTRFGGDAVQGVFQELIAVGEVLPSQLERVTKATLDYSSATGIDLSTATNVVAKAMAGNTGQLSRYGITIDRSIPKIQRAEKVLEELEKRFGGFAQKDIETYSGRLAQMANNFDDLKEAIGKSFIAFTGWDKAMSQLSEFFKSIEPQDVVITKLSTLQDRLSKVRVEIEKLNNSSKNTSALDWLSERQGGGDAARSIQQRIDKMAILQHAEAQYLSEIEKEVRATSELATARREVEKISISSDNQGVSSNIAKYMERLEEFRAQNVDNQRADLEEEFQGYETLFEKKETILNAFSKQRRILESQVTKQIDSETKKQLELELESLKIREDNYANFLKSREELEKMKFEAMDKVSKDTFLNVGFFARSAASSLEDGFFNVVTGKFRELEDVVADFGNTLLREILRIAAIKTIGFFIPGFTGHQGGLVRAGGATSSGYSSRGRGAPYIGRMHSGGEVSATLREGEGVVSERGMRSLGKDNLHRLNSGQGVGGGDTINNYYIQTIDERSFRDRLSQNGDIYAGAAERGIADNHSIRRTVQRFGT